MTQAVQLAMIDLGKVAIQSLIGLLAAWFSYRAVVHAKANLAVSKEIKVQTDGMKDALVAAATITGKAEGKAEQQREDRKP